jgi:hypothetical protein
MRSKLIAMIIGFAATVAGCSSSGTSGAGGGAPSAGNSSTGTSTSTGTATSTATSTSTKNALGGGGGGGSYCSDLRKAKTQIESLSKMGAAGGSIELSLIVSAIHKAADEAPAGVKADWNLLATTFSKFLNDLIAAGINPTNIQYSKLTKQQLQAFENAAKPLNQPDVMNAETRIDANVKSVCGIDLNG